MKKSTRIITTTLGLALALGSGIATRADDDDSDRSSGNQLKGTWALSIEGTTTSMSVLAPPGTSLVAVATVTFDKHGSCTSIDQVIIDGQYIPSRDGFRSTEPNGACTYQINDDGTGFFDVTFPDAGVTTTTFVLSNKNQMAVIATNATLGIMGGGEMRKQKN